MKITVEITENDLLDICRYTGESEKSSAINKLIVDALMLKRRKEVAEKFLTGEWSTDLPDWRETREMDNRAD